MRYHISSLNCIHSLNRILMIVTDLIGGIGNQLFQYCAGRSLAYTNHVDLKLNISGFDGYKLRRYALNHFNFDAEILSEDEQKTLTIYSEKSFRYDPDFFDLTDHTFIKGYWQSEKYFSMIKDVLLTELQIITPPSKINEKLIDEIQSCNAVSLHIRRGDYISDISTYKVHGICDLDYYDRCLKIVAEQIFDPHVYIFSDDPRWAIDHLRIDLKTTYVTHNDPEHHYEDLRLMSLCRHNIIANSSFSWWGAWLNKHQDKIVLAPKRWFRRDVPDASDLIPNHWLKV